MKATKTLTFQGNVNDIDRKISGAQKVESQSLWSTLPSENDSLPQNKDIILFLLQL
jgi:hypothetical protein